MTLASKVVKIDSDITILLCSATTVTKYVLMPNEVEARQLVKNLLDFVTLNVVIPRYERSFF